MELEGRRVLVTRARGQNRELGRRLEALGAEVLEIPTIEIREPETWQPLDDALRSLDDYDWIVFTSANGVEAFSRRAGPVRLPRVAVVGSQTAGRAGSLGIPVDLLPSDFRTEGLLGALPEDLTGTRMLLPRGDLASDALPLALGARGARVDAVVVYRTRVPSAGGRELGEILEQGLLDYVTFTSGSTVGNLMSLLNAGGPEERLAGTTIAVIGPVTRQAVESFGLTVDVEAGEATIPALVEAIRRHARGTRP